MSKKLLIEEVPDNPSGVSEIVEMVYQTRDSELNHETELTKEQYQSLEESLSTKPSDLPILRKFCIDRLTLLDDFKAHKDTYEVLLILKMLIQYDDINEYVGVLSLHSNPNVTWGTTKSSAVVSLIDTSKVNWNEFILSVKPSLLVFPTVKRLQGGLRPRLGYGGAKKEIIEEDARRKWKSSSIGVLSLMWFLIDNIQKGDWFEDNWMVITSFLLNLGGDYEIVYKYQNMMLLNHFLNNNGEELIMKTGLHDLFVEMSKSCLVHIPPLTPIEESFQLLRVGYPCVLRLVHSQSQLTETINSSILNSISYLMNGRENYKIISLLVDNLSTIITNKKVLLVSLTRISFTLNQIITNPYVLDVKDGVALICRALQCQKVILSHFISSASHLLYSYKFDLLGVWVIMLKRINLFEYQEIEHLIRENFSIFREVVKSSNREIEFEEILQRIQTDTGVYIQEHAGTTNRVDGVNIIASSA